MYNSDLRDQRKTYATPELEVFGDVATLTATFDSSKLDGEDPAGSGPMEPPRTCDHHDFPFCGC